MEFLKETSEILDTYNGRDKVVRTLCYSARLMGVLSSNPLFTEKCTRFSKHMSSTRAVLRMLDDLPMLHTLIEYGFGEKEPDKYMAKLGTIRNVIDQLYYPIEKVAWFAENNLISVKNPSVWDTASSMCWVASVYLNLMKSIRFISVLQKHKSCLRLKDNSSNELLNIDLQQQFQILVVVRCCLDLVHAVHTLPPGYLWSSSLKPWQVSLIGTVSSLLGMYQIIWKRSVAKKQLS